MTENALNHQAYSFERMRQWCLASVDEQARGWDLHCHTEYSDGTASVSELLALAKQRGLQGVAITDHDTCAGWNDCFEACNDVHMPVLFGTEITAQARNGKISVHMLAYQYNPDDTVLAGLFHRMRQARLLRTKAMVEAIAADFPITWSDVLEQVKRGRDTTVGRPHIADALVQAGVYQNRSQAFEGAVSVTGKYYIPTPSPSVMAVIEAVKHAQGVSVIAHPYDTNRNAYFLSDEEIATYVQQGLDGLEVYHRGNDADARQRLLALAHKHHLLVTGGSDWHGAGKPNQLGEHTTSHDVVETMIHRGWQG